MSAKSTPADLALHGVRVLGFTSAERVAERYELDAASVEELLLDDEAYGWVRRSSFAGSSGWSVTDAGRGEDERRMRTELDRVGARGLVEQVHTEFRPLNERFGQACTDWQLRPNGRDDLAFNDHSDWRWDERVLERLSSGITRVCGLAERLADQLRRFDPYPPLYASALARVDAGQHAWIDAPDRDSLHTVWIQFHEDLLATLGIPRGDEPA